MSRLRTITVASLLVAVLCWPIAAAATPEQDKEVAALRHGLGTATASALYHTHLFISATADGYKGKVFQAAQVRNALRTSAQVTDSLLDDLTRIRATKLTAKDAAQLDELIAMCDLVTKEARLISGLIRLGTKEAERSYAEHHQKVRARLGKLLGL